MRQSYGHFERAVMSRVCADCANCVSFSGVIHFSVFAVGSPEATARRTRPNVT